MLQILAGVLRVAAAPHVELIRALLVPVSTPAFVVVVEVLQMLVAPLLVVVVMVFARLEWGLAAFLPHAATGAPIGISIEAFAVGSGHNRRPTDHCASHIRRLAAAAGLIEGLLPTVPTAGGAVVLIVLATALAMAFGLVALDGAVVLIVLAAAVDAVGSVAGATIAAQAVVRAEIIAAVSLSVGID